MRGEPSSENAGRGRRRLARRVYGWLSLPATAAGVAYILLLCFPQALFAHEVTHHNFKVYAREPVDPNVHAVLDGL